MTKSHHYVYLIFLFRMALIVVLFCVRVPSIGASQIVYLYTAEVSSFLEVNQSSNQINTFLILSITYPLHTKAENLIELFT